MALFFNNAQGATKISAPPRVVTVYDNVAGCPPSRSNPILTATITVSNPTLFRVMGTFIRYLSGRNDLYIRITGPAGSNYASETQIATRLNYTSGTAWDNVVWDTSAYGNAAGTYTVSVHAATPSSWGCGRYHGRMSVIAFEVS